MTPDVAIAVSPRDWAEELHRFIADHGGARVRARVLDAREAVDEHYHVLVAEDLSSFLTVRMVAELHRTGRRVLGVYDEREPWGRQRLVELGVDEVLPSTSGPDALLRAVEVLAVEATSDLDAELRALRDVPSDPVESGGPGPGRLLAVAGPPGGTGRTELAIGVGHALTETGATAVVVDADDVAPSLAQRMGLALHPNLRTAVDVVEHWSGHLVDCLQPVSGSSMMVLAGLASGRDAAELRPAEAVGTLDALRDGHDHVVVDVGPCLEEVGGLGSGHGRYALTRAVLGAADVVVGVGACSPVGVARFVEWVAQARAVTDAPLAVALNRASPSGFERGELEEELTRTFEPAGLWFVPEDKRVREAAWAGTIVRRGPYRRALRSVAIDLAELTAVRVTSPTSPPTGEGTR